jgi:hypothetical protein
LKPQPAGSTAGSPFKKRWKNLAVAILGLVMRPIAEAYWMEILNFLEILTDHE